MSNAVYGQRRSAAIENNLDLRRSGQADLATKFGDGRANVWRQQNFVALCQQVGMDGGRMIGPVQIFHGEDICGIAT